MITALSFVLVSLAADFEAHKAKAHELEAIDKAVAALVGDCKGADFESAIDCQNNRKTEQKKLRRDEHYIYMGVPENGGIHFEGVRSNGKARLTWTPMIDAGGYAFSIGRPHSLDAQGRPVFKLKILDVTMNSGVSESDFIRGVRTGNLGVEVIGRFGKTWKKTKRGRAAEGVSFKPKALRIVNARNGKTLGEMTF